MTLRGPPLMTGKNCTSALCASNLSSSRPCNGQRPAVNVPRRPDSKRGFCGTVPSGLGAYLYLCTISFISSQATRLPGSRAVDLVQSALIKLVPADSDHASRPKVPFAQRTVPYLPCFLSFAHIARKSSPVQFSAGRLIMSERYQIIMLLYEKGRASCMSLYDNAFHIAGKVSERNSSA